MYLQFFYLVSVLSITIWDIEKNESIVNMGIAVSGILNRLINFNERRHKIDAPSA